MATSKRKPKVRVTAKKATKVRRTKKASATK